MLGPIVEPGIRNVKYPVEGNDDCEGYYNECNSKMGIVVVSEWWGLNKSICTTSDIISGYGYQTLVPDIYRGKTAVDHEDAGHLMNGLNFQSAVNDILGAVSFLRKKGCAKVFLTGFCMGGALTLATCSSSDQIDLAIPFYGVPSQEYFPIEKTKCKVLLNVGSLDDLKGFSDPEYCLSITEKAKKAGVNIELKIWEGGKHAFLNQDSEKYNESLAKEALKYMMDFIASNTN